MSCCAPGTEAALELAGEALPSDEELLLASRPLGNGLRQVDLSVPDVHCGACIATIEGALKHLEGMESARVNLSTKRVSASWRDGTPPPPIMSTLSRLGYRAHLFDPGAGDKDEQLSELIRALGVAGFAAANIMLLSVSVWSGADAATRDFLHIVSALIALPALVYSGRIFFRSALGALRHGRSNMDVPISIGVITAYVMSLYETMTSGPHAYFDAAVTLLFFLLIGRTLDHVMRERARVAVKGLARLSARGATIVSPDGSRAYLPVAEIEPGMTILLAAGERVPVDAKVLRGRSDLDRSLVTGESRPEPVEEGARLQAGTLNLTGPLTLEAAAPARDSFLAEMMRLMEAAEGGRARYRRIADRMAQLYAPVVHLVALITLVGWVMVTGDWHRSILIAIAVLIITCPCALGLAVPIVQVIAARRLFEQGIMVKDGSAMERLAEADTVVFDKTGTLTLGRPRLVNADEVAPADLALAAALAVHSRHPLSLALAEAAGNAATQTFEHIAELPGLGVEARNGAEIVRLGRANWALPGAAGDPAGAGTVLSRNGKLLAAFHFEDRPREGAAAAVAALARAGLPAEIVSGDREAEVAAMARQLGIVRFEAGMLPGAKTERLKALSAAGHKPLMVGDGLNDAPALAAAHVSMAPANAADIGRQAADLVFLRDNLSAVPAAIDLSRRAGVLIRQNFAIATVYNVVAVPIAVLGYVTPLVAAIAMSVSSVIVVLNAMRLKPARVDAVESQPQATQAAARGLRLEPAE
ncbi:cadmium-translocating P-type ATPase [Chelativorans sp. ZYF759]|uniref:heavy metal translocating P-type ATPase n=1 Tax=Chelativorans sp. ZYF759 TaxID=2692213 RepID=UPI00145D5956|nr:heavy metal translocating P-type ATPase [Chelativorans sp. ZYF759]NMG40642.1 cadmium-translocating P-type ATPase [Chelativorans sp. ZYF759]